MAITCSLDPNSLTTFLEFPWGKIWLSSYHLTLNPNACRFDLDAYQERPVLPDDIVVLTTADVYKPAQLNETE